MLLWAAEHEATNDLDDVLGMAADIRGITVADDDSALEVLLTRDSGGSLRGCLEAKTSATRPSPMSAHALTLLIRRKGRSRSRR